MRQCLVSDLGGYYTAETAGRDQFGQKGDFVTSPEISQTFGELVGLWVVAEWMAQGKKREGVYLMEVGPGRGTLMDDILRTIRNFKDFSSAIEAVYLVEASQGLRQAQHKLLCGDNPLKETESGHESYSKYAKDLKIVWCEDVRLLPKEGNKTPFIVAHEFFDALPIHIFQSVPPAAAEQIQTPTGPIDAKKLPRSSRENQWRELVVSPTPPFATHSDLGTPKNMQSGPVPDFQLTLSKAATPHSMYLPEQSDRYKAIKSTDHALIEVSPESHAYAADFAVRIGGGQLPTARHQQSRPNTHTVSAPSEQDVVEKSQPSGAALIMDYGPASTIPANSLRGIKRHEHVSPLSEAGTVDISADVDFLGLAESAINASLGVEVHGPIDQARFLTAMGIQERAAQLVKQALDKERGGKKDDNSERKKEDLTETVKRIETGWKRLVDRGPQGMGKLYQFMAIVPHRPVKQGEQMRRPVAFGGDIAVS